MKVVARFANLARLRAPCARSSHGVSSARSSLYVLGGEAIARTPFPDMTLHVLPLTEPAAEWRTVAAPPGGSPPPRIAHAQAVVGDELLMFGGRAGVAMDELAMSDLWSLQLDTETWAPVAPASGSPPSPRSFHAATAAGEKMYVFGGVGDAGRLADLHEFDATSRAWRRLPDPPSDVVGRGGATLEATTDGKSLWLVGGFAGHETRDVLRYDVRAETWARAPSEWLRPRSVAASFSVGGVIFVFGGEVSPSDRGHEGAGGFADDLIAFDAATGAPLHVEVVSDAPAGSHPRLPSARGWGGAAATSDSSAALFGGLAGDDEAPTRLGDTWTVSVDFA